MGKRVSTSILKEIDKNYKNSKYNIFEKEIGLKLGVNTNGENEEQVENKIKIEFKKYLPITEKDAIAQVVALNCVDDEGNINETQGLIATRLLIVSKYTNLNLLEDEVESYDILMKTGLYGFINETIEHNDMEELNELNQIINSKVKNLSQQRKDKTKDEKNNITKSIIGLIDNINEKLEQFTPDKLGDLVKGIEGFDPDKVKFIKDFMKVNKGESIKETEVVEVVEDKKADE